MQKQQFKITNDIKAGQSDRFINSVVDYLAVMAIVVITGFVAQFMSILFGYDGLSFWFDTMSKGEEYLFGYLLYVGYYFVFELLTARTLGKFITGTMVVTDDDKRPDAKVILIRSLCRIIPFDALTFLGNISSGWHDRFSNTHVVKKKLYVLRKNTMLEFDEIGEGSEVL